MTRSRLRRYTILSLIVAFVVGETYLTYRYFRQLNRWVGQPAGATSGPHSATMAQVCFMVIALILMFILFRLRTLLLIALVGGQMSLFLISPTFTIFTLTLPNFGVIGLNGIYVLGLYFLFSRQKWAPQRIDVDVDIRID